jgi:ATP-dependent DNA helicase RecQ
MPMSSEPSAESFLSRFGLAAFRPGQREVIESLFAGQDCLCIMPTGGGKSLCYQLPAVARPGVTLVVSPLIALMKDQVDQLQANDIPATFINSSLSLGDQNGRLQQMREGRYQLVYIAPERLRNSRFLEVVHGLKIGLLAIDEAHCISHWGHDFRPDYMRLGRFRERLGNPQTIALTATATPKVQQDIVAQLRLAEPQVFITGFARPNLHFEVWPARSDSDKYRQIADFLPNAKGAGIVYAATRRACEELVEGIRSITQRPVGLYHAGLLPDDRRRVQDDFRNGRVEIMVATNAFGMGIDRRDLRFVLHYNLPGSLEAYYQEAGRAGRDGLPSRCILLLNESDRRIQEFFIENSYPPRDVVESVYDYLRELRDDPIELTQQELKDRLRLPIGNEAVSSSEKLLEQCGALERLDTRQNQASVKITSDLPTLVDLLPSEAKNQRKVLRAVEKIVGEVRHERVYFPPARLAGMTELEAGAVTRALKELRRLEAFDFCPAFRGRAIHMLERKKPFNELGIDFEELDRRRDEEYHKLDEVVRFARGTQCRQSFFLKYFGDKSDFVCGKCDNCGGGKADVADVAEAAVGVSDEQTLSVVQMALAGVARTQGRVGKTLVAKMLAGSGSSQISKLRLDQLSTFGLLSQWKQTEVQELLEALLAIRLIELVENTRFRPLVTLTELGGQVMRGQAALPRGLTISPDVQMRIRMTAVGKPQAPRGSSLAALPKTELSSTALSSLESPDDEPPSFEPVDEPPLPDWHWTRRLAADGYSPEEIAAIRRLSVAEVAQQLRRADAESP